MVGIVTAGDVVGICCCNWTAMVVGYVTTGDVVEAKKVFDEMPYRNVASWNAMIRGFVKVGDLSSVMGVEENAKCEFELQ